MTGHVLQFNGAASKVDVPYSAALNPTSFTVEIWAKITGDPGRWRSPITCRDDAPEHGYLIYGGDNNRWQFWIGHGSGWSVIEGPAIEYGKWTHVAGTYDGSSQNMLFYIDGHRVGARTSALVLNARRPLRIGAGETEHAGEYWFDGQLCDARVWNRVRSEAQIQEAMSERLRGDEPGLVGYWPISKGTGTSVIGRTAARHDGAIFDGIWEACDDLPVSERAAPSGQPEHQQSADHANTANGGGTHETEPPGGPGTPGGGSDYSGMSGKMLSLKQFTHAIQSAATEAAQAVSFKNLEVINHLFEEVEGELPPLLPALPGENEATEGQVHQAVSPTVDSTTAGGQKRTYLKPRMVLMQYPHVGEDGPISHLVHVPLVSLVPLAQFQIKELRFKTDLELGVSGGNVTVGFPKSQPAGTGEESSGEAQPGRASLEIVIGQLDAPSGYKHVLDGYDKALRAQIPG